MGIIMGTMPEPNNTILLLLTISGASLSSSKFIKKEGAEDTVNDENRISFLNANNSKAAETHRLQAFLFNLTYMIYFLFLGFGNLYLPEFLDNTFLLLGIGNGVYTGKKTMESRA